MVGQGALDHPLVLLYGTLLLNTRKIGENKKKKITNLLPRCIPTIKIRACLNCLGINSQTFQKHTFKSDLESNTLLDV